MANGDPLKIGNPNTGTSQTSLNVAISGYGFEVTNTGLSVLLETAAAVAGIGSGGAGVGVLGKGLSGTGVLGVGLTGVVGNSQGGDGVLGACENGNGVHGKSTNGVGVFGESQNNEGVHGASHNSAHGGVVGYNTAGGIAVFGSSDGGVGVWGTSVNYEGIHAETKSSSTAAMAAYQTNAASNTAAFFAKHMGNHTAGRFEGDVEVTGDIRLTNADCAEDFDVLDAEQAEPGTVMVIDETGALQQSQQAYDKKVAGVVSGAGGYKPGIVLHRQQSQQRRQPIALLGKVYCKVDAQYAAIEVGDLLTTSPTPGHAMKAQDPFKAFGAVIGKALRPFANGKGLIPILIALQ